MTIEDGLILRGEALIIPPSERGKVLESIHEGHLGIFQMPVPSQTVCLLAWYQRRHQEGG